MESWIWVVDNNADNFEAVQKEWLKHHVFIRMAKSMQEVLKSLANTDFLLVLIVADNIAYLPHLKLMCAEYRKLFLKGKEIELTRKEFDFLHLHWSVYTHEQIYRHVWADETDNVSADHAV